MGQFAVDVVLSLRPSASESPSATSRSTASTSRIATDNYGRIGTNVLTLFHVAYVDAPHIAGFWQGLWQGAISPVTFPIGRALSRTLRARLSGLGWPNLLQRRYIPPLPRCRRSSTSRSAWRPR